MEHTEEEGKDDFHVPLKTKRLRPPSGEGCFVLRGAGSGKVDHPLSQTIDVALPARGTSPPWYGPRELSRGPFFTVRRNASCLYFPYGI